MKKVKTFIPVAFPDLTGNEKKYLEIALSSSWISSSGKYIDQFESDFAKFSGCQFAVSTTNGTSALHLALLALGIGKGDEVVIPDLTFIATANAVTYCGATPVLADIDNNGFGISVSKLEKLITKKTKAIIPVHLYGLPSDMESIMRIAQKYNLSVIEDCAEAQGAQIKIQGSWKKVGSIGHTGCFSFYGNKIMTTGEGGMVVTDDKSLAEKMQILRDHGQDPAKHYFHPLIGFNYRMTNLQAAVGLAQLERFNKLLAFKNKISRLYKNYLQDIPGIIFPETKINTRPVCWLFSAVVDKPFKLSRDLLMDKLASFGIETRPFFIPIHRQPSYLKKDLFPNSDYYSRHGFNLPSGYNLTESEIKFISEKIKHFS